MIIPISFICDEGYVMPTCVAITSLIAHASEDPDMTYDIYILGVGITEKSKEIMTSLNRDRIRVSVIECDLNEKQKQIVNYGRHVTQTSVMRFELPNILPQYDKVIYLDSDILVLGSLADLFQSDIESVYAGVVKDYLAAKDKRHLEFLEFHEYAYFNSGVMLMNLKKMREDNMPEKLLDYRIHGKNRYMDQDALNVVFDGKVKYLSPYFNVFTLWYANDSIEKLSQFYDTKFPESREKIYLKAEVLHFGDRRKPWTMELGYLTGLYYLYYRLSPYGESKLMWIAYPWTNKAKYFWKKVKRRLGIRKMHRKGIY